MKFPLITAHTGCMGTKPNTVASVLKGIKYGADIIEVDIRATADGIVVLSHDGTVETPACGLKTIEDTGYSDLKKQGAELVRLEDIIELIQNNVKTFNIDIKDDRAVAPLLSLMRRINMADCFVLTGCGKDMAKRITGSCSGLRVLMDVDIEPLTTEKSSYSELVKQWCSDAVEACCSAFNIPYRVCTDELVERAAKRCLPVCIYTVDEAELMKRYADMGVFSITTNRVDMLKKIRHGG